MTSSSQALSPRGLGLLAVGVAALAAGYFWAGVYGAYLVALPGLLWSRGLRPLDNAGRLGALLCWLAITAWPVALHSYYFQGPYLGVGDVWDFCVSLYGASVLVWLCVKHKFFKPSAASVPRALLASALGALLTCPMFVPPGIVQPLLTAPLLLFNRALREGADLHAFLFYLGAQFVCMGCAFLIVEWPARQRARDLAARALAWRGEFKLLFCYLIASTVMSLIMIATEYAKSRSYVSVLAAHYYWIPLAPVAGIYQAAVDMFSTTARTSSAERFLHFIMVTLSFAVPLAVSMAFAFKRVSGIAKLIADMRGTRDALLSGRVIEQRAGALVGSGPAQQKGPRPDRD